MSDDEIRIDLAGSSIHSTSERDYYAGFSVNKKHHYRIHDIVR